jgi:hypothetical protein
MYQRPDRYRLIQADLSRRSRIARAGSYSYAATSFGAGSVTVNGSEHRDGKRSSA